MGSVTAETITDQQIAAVTDVCGYSPGNRDAFCPKCQAVAPHHCKGRTRVSHAARKQVGDLLRFLYREHCAGVWNARNGGSQ